MLNHTLHCVEELGITAAAENDCKLPATFKRIHKFGEKGLSIFPVEVFNEAAAENFSDTAQELMSSLNQLPSQYTTSEIVARLFTCGFIHAH